ncbi:DUF397 domain-containing protein [Streptoverticillium reticulum]|uniref:DUF397 domain-containing protein n=1 Tax=Streptoverticillium reticulum TaxID=1433415 RepID=UPI0039BFEC16
MCMGGADSRRTVPFRLEAAHSRTHRGKRVMTGRVPAWRKSSYSGSNNNCLEHAAFSDGRHAVRDTKDPRRRITISFSANAWRAFIDSQKRSDR